MELTRVLTPFPKSLWGLSIDRGLVCAHMHSVARTQKILTFMSPTGECRQQKHTQHAPSTKMECKYLCGWVIKKKKKKVAYAKISPKMVNPRGLAGNAEEEEEFVGCLASQQHACVSQGRICIDNFTCCHTEIEVADHTFHLTQSQYTDTGPTSPSTDPIAPGAWQGSHWSTNF